MDHVEIFDHFQELSHNRDVEDCLRILNCVDWNLDSALVINEYLHSGSGSNYTSVGLENKSNLNMLDNKGTTKNPSLPNSRNLVLNAVLEDKVIIVVMSEDETVGDFEKAIGNLIDDNNAQFDFTGFKEPYDRSTLLKSFHFESETDIVCTRIDIFHSNRIFLNIDCIPIDGKYDLSIDVYIDDLLEQSLNIIFDGKDSVQKVKHDIAKFVNIASHKLYWFGWREHVKDEITLEKCGISKRTTFTATNIDKLFSGSKPYFKKSKMDSSIEQMTETPITQIGIIADKTKLPFMYNIIDKTSDGSDDADLWRDGLFRRTYRYLCISKDQTCPNVLVGLQLINDREEAPVGFAAIDITMDSGEKAIKKKILCVKFVPKAMAKTFITDISIFSRTKRMPAGYTLVSELNNLLIAYKLATVPQSNLPITNNRVENFNFVPKIDDYSKATIGRGITPLSGVPFNLSKRFAQQSKQSLTSSYQFIDYKNATQIYNQYNYDFGVENSVLRDH